jgi:hypothetical protein
MGCEVRIVSQRKKCITAITDTMVFPIFLPSIFFRTPGFTKEYPIVVLMKRAVIIPFSTCSATNYQLLSTLPFLWRASFRFCEFELCQADRTRIQRLTRSCGFMKVLRFSVRAPDNRAPDTDNFEEGDKEKPPFPLWPIKLFLAYGFVLFSYKLLPQMSDSMVSSGFKLCQSSRDSSFTLVGLQRIRAHLNSKELCQKMFEHASFNSNSVGFAEVLCRSLNSSDQEIRAEALALAEKVLELWPDSAQHLNKIDFEQKMNSAKESHVSGETLEDTKNRIDRLAALLKKM